MDKQKLHQIAKDASEKAYSPYSNAKVGAAVLTSTGEIFSGCNIENSSYGGTICAERVAIFKAVSKGLKQLQVVYVYSKDGWPPCGLCRQVIAEFATKDTIVMIGSEQGTQQEISFDKIFPLAFTPKHLE